MKQHVTPRQLQEVPKEKLVEIYGDKYGSKLNDYRKDFYEHHHKKFTIGKMIEILANKSRHSQQIINEGGRYCVTCKIHEYHKNLPPFDYTLGRLLFDIETEYHNELCDALWEAIKEIL